MERQLEVKKIPFRDIYKTFRYEHLAGGLCGGAVSTFVLHPLELIRIRFSVSDPLTNRPRYRSMWHCTSEIWKTDGMRGIFRGANSNVVAHSVQFGLYFLFYNSLKVLLGDGSPNPDLTVSKYLLCGCVSGSLTLVATNPLWTVRTRLCLEYDGVSYSNMAHAMRVLYHTDGMKGFYRGFVPGIFGTSHGAIQFLVYEKMKHWHQEKYRYGNDHKLGAGPCIVMSGVSKFVAVVMTYPYIMIRACLQDHHRNFSGPMEMMRITWRNESWRGFYKGLGVCLLRMVPSTCIMFYVYEAVVHQLMFGLEPTSTLRSKKQ